MNGSSRRRAAISSLFLFLALLSAIPFAARPAIAQFADASEAAATSPTDDADTDTGVVPLLSADDLNTLVAPVALYPDELLALVLPASTNPLQVVEAQRFLEKQKADASLQPDDSWDPAVIALLNYPEVIKQMNDDLGWTQDLGNAVMDQQEDVLNAIQAARAAAADAGYLQSNDQQVVVNDNDNIVIQSAEPDVIYVPTYDPAPIIENTYVDYPPPVYSPPYPAYYAPGATFLAGAIVGTAFAYAFDWNDNDIDIDNDINVSRGDTNIGSGNTNIDKLDKSKIQDRFNSNDKVGDKGGTKWSPEKARQKSTAQRKVQSRPTSTAISQKLGQGPTAGTLKPADGLKGAGAPNKVKPKATVQKQSQRGQQSLANNKKPKKQAQQTRQQPSKQLKPNQLKQKKGGAFQQMPPKKTAKAQSARGNKSMKASGHSRPRRR